MRKRLICGAWMAAGIVVAFLLRAQVSQDPLSAFDLALAAGVGFMAGAVVLSPAVGSKSNFWWAAFGGMASAAIFFAAALTLSVLAGSLKAQSIASINFGSELSLAFDYVALGALFYFWIVLPLGALNGLILQCFWMRRVRASASDDEGVQGPRR